MVVKIISASVAQHNALFDAFINQSSLADRRCCRLDHVHNFYDMMDVIYMTPHRCHHRLRFKASRSARAIRSSMRNRDRPPPTLVYASAGTTSVQLTGTENGDPSAS